MQIFFTRKTYSLALGGMDAAVTKALTGVLLCKTPKEKSKFSSLGVFPLFSIFHCRQSLLMAE
jgi:hypothetical protein